MDKFFRWKFRGFVLNKFNHLSNVIKFSNFDWILGDFSKFFLVSQKKKHHYLLHFEIHLCVFNWFSSCFWIDWILRKITLVKTIFVEKKIISRKLLKNDFVFQCKLKNNIFLQGGKIMPPFWRPFWKTKNWKSGFSRSRPFSKLKKMCSEKIRFGPQRKVSYYFPQ